MNFIKLNKIEVLDSLVRYYFTPSDKMQKYFFPANELFIDYEVSMSNVPLSILTIPFVSLMLPIIWVTDCVLWVDEIDTTFYNSTFKIKRAYQELYTQFLFKGLLVPAKLVDNTYTIQRESVLLYSGGVDANSSYIRILEQKPLLININGWVENTNEVDKVFLKDKNDINEFAKNEQVETTFILSNFTKFINQNLFNHKFKAKLGNTLWYGFQHSMAFISLSIPLAYQLGVERIYIASSDSPDTLNSRYICGSYPTTDIQFKFSEKGYTIHDGYELTRQDKVKLIIDHNEKVKHDLLLRVCSFNDENCCECIKCFRTIVEIIAEGRNIKDYGFNIEGNLAEHFESVMKKKIHGFDIKTELDAYWGVTMKRMVENKDIIVDHEMVEWFLTYDFIGNYKKSKTIYRITSFFKLAKAKLKIYRDRYFK